MSSTGKQAANRRNAQESTGPRSGAGKQRSSANALRHGILSAHLILPGESRADFDSLFSALVDEMRPVGTLEMALVERIAISLWRQRRLVRAETAAIQMQVEARSYQDQVQVAQLVPENSRKLARDILSGDAQASTLDEATALNLEQGVLELRKRMQAAQPGSSIAIPKELADMMVVWGEQEGMTWQEWYKANYKSIEAFASAIEGALFGFRHGAHIERAIELYRCARLMPENSDRISRYQVALDNELYKALRALREAQTWRLRTIDVAPSMVQGAPP